MEKVIALSGKASQVFRFWALLVQNHGEKKLGDLLKGFDESTALNEMRGRE